MRGFIERVLVSLLITGEADNERIDCYFRFLGLTVTGAYFLLLSRGKHPVSGNAGDGVRSAGVMEIAEPFLAQTDKCLAERDNSVVHYLWLWS